jgi:cytoskeletal protein CcmA (bactofilin family)
MFSKGNKSASRRPTPSIIGADCTFTGDILSEGEVQIDGHLAGDLRCRALVIGEQGSVIGEITADTVSVLGTVTGQITAQTVALASTARILGDITHGSLSVEVGAYVEGRFNRLPVEPAAKELTNDAGATHNASGQALLSKPTDTAKDNSEESGITSPPKVALIGG